MNTQDKPRNHWVLLLVGVLTFPCALILALALSPAPRSRVVAAAPTTMATTRMAHLSPPAVRVYEVAPAAPAPSHGMEEVERLNRLQLQQYHQRVRRNIQSPPSTISPAVIERVLEK